MDIETITLTCQAQLAAAGIEFDEDECSMGIEENLSSGTTYTTLYLNAEGSRWAVFELSGYQILGYQVLARVENAVVVVEQVVL